MAKLLFILKKRLNTYDENVNNSQYCVGLSTGLINSVKFVVDMLHENNIEAKFETAIDNNCIDRMVRHYKPTHVIIEAFWVVPEKFEILTKLHPNVHWIIRNHSEMPFLSTEGVGVKWLLEYVKRKHVFVSTNSIESYHDVLAMLESVYGKEFAKEKLLYLPNYYKVKVETLKKSKIITDTIDIGCFGAIRPLKNQMIQAISAVEFAQKHKLNLRFHINSARIECDGSTVLRSIRALFEQLDKDVYQLIEHPWLDHDKFLELVATMDLGMQISFTETFNIIAADFVACGVPILVSKEIKWMPAEFTTPTADSNVIVEKMIRILDKFDMYGKSRKALRALHDYNTNSREVWTKRFTITKD